ncbi:lysophospholipid acyltransferase family protein [Rhizosaccharibacter radicis]|uniref:1-acyl-sn-glycerol-3-phosphate acyltransferase n=1 Tax=Rhizosaccharibacter radicis TaxID=2782605 RepID=A0ABT1VYZ5_9PROT|nr:1-acyl-sn-glycerol-3-phosphate acyltransferase [Acetobacteraceae bacterium KSS12]
MTILRAALFNLYFVVLTVAMGIAALPVRLVFRSHALAYAQRWAGWSLNGLHAICGIRLKVTGLEHLPGDGPALLVSQHQSAYDTLVWMNLVPRPAYVMKQELVRIPLVGPMLLLSGMIPLDRGAGAGALRALLRDAGSAVADRRQIVIFPEGTRVAAGQSVPLQPGVAALASHLGVPVLPVSTDSGRCWSRRAFIKRRGVIHIDIGAPLPPGLRRAALLDAVRAGWTGLETARGLAPPSASRVTNPVDKFVE